MRESGGQVRNSAIFRALFDQFAAGAYGAPLRGHKPRERPISEWTVPPVFRGSRNGVYGAEGGVALAAYGAPLRGHKPRERRISEWEYRLFLEAP